MHAYSAVLEPVENIATAKIHQSPEQPLPADLHSGQRSTLVIGKLQVFTEDERTQAFTSQPLQPRPIAQTSLRSPIRWPEPAVSTRVIAQPQAAKNILCCSRAAQLNSALTMGCGASRLAAPR